MQADDQAFRFAASTERHPQPRRHRYVTLTTAFGTCTLLLLATILALVREVRLRRALQRLLVRLLSLWRNPHARNATPP
jgi:hypothetical protein